MLIYSVKLFHKLIKSTKNKIYVDFYYYLVEIERLFSKTFN